MMMQLHVLSKFCCAQVCCYPHRCKNTRRFEMCACLTAVSSAWNLNCPRPRLLVLALTLLLLCGMHPGTPHTLWGNVCSIWYMTMTKCKCELCLPPTQCARVLLVVHPPARLGRCASAKPRSHRVYTRKFLKHLRCMAWQQSGTRSS